MKKAEKNQANKPTEKKRHRPGKARKAVDDLPDNLSNLDWSNGGRGKDDKQAATAFLKLLQAEIQNLNDKKLISSENGDWVVKGFIDIFKNVYTISGDTKVISKLIELMLFPHFLAFADKHKLKVILSREQNHYPDLTFVDESENKFAVDLKSTYRINSEKVNTMTLGAFTGYFRNRSSTKNATFPYGEYASHFVLGVIYSRVDTKISEFKLHSLDDLEEIPSVIKDVEFFVQPKYRIANHQPGSGNTKNIGAVWTIAELIIGNGPFAALGEAVFDDYWMYYLTSDMARAVDLEKPPYKNLATYFAYKNISPRGQK
ncbi:MAG: EcoRV family type II restriction endonuclease [Acidobacteria bacterium]|nr:EcoRV family type II restriction endonuclease [Acidobacteriota bacterium]